MRSDHAFDALLPAEIAAKAELIGVQKTRLDRPRLFVLAVLAGAFIAIGAMLSTVAQTASGNALPYGLVRLLAGLVFSVGLILVVVGGAELFTGNNLMVMAWASGKIRLLEMLRAWLWVYLGNFVGALGTAALVFLAGDYGHANGALGATALAIAEAKTAMPFFPAVVHGILCNVLVCLAVWLSFSAHSTTDKILAVVPPITAFVAAGYEHSVANMYFIPYGLLVKAFAPSSFWTAVAATPATFPTLTLQGLVANLVPVTIGNVIGGGILVGAVYWFVYLRNRPAP